MVLKKSEGRGSFIWSAFVNAVKTTITKHHWNWEWKINMKSQNKIHINDTDISIDIELISDELSILFHSISSFVSSVLQFLFFQCLLALHSVVHFYTLLFNSVFFLTRASSCFMVFFALCQWTIRADYCWLVWKFAATSPLAHYNLRATICGHRQMLKCIIVSCSLCTHTHQ